MKIRIELTEDDLRALVRQQIERRLGDLAFMEERIRIEVKSKQNFKSEWETSAFRAVLEL